MSSENKIRVLIADDHPVVRKGLALMIHYEPDMEMAAEACNGREAMEMFCIHRPDVTLMDLKMPDMGGVEAIRGIRAECPSAQIIVLSTYQGDEDIYRALEAGAVTYLLKDMIADKMMDVIREVAGGGRPILPEVAQLLTSRIFKASLTSRELEVLQLIAVGRRNKEIAGELKISDETVQGHVKNILAKLGVHDRTEAVAVAVRRGIVHLD